MNEKNLIDYYNKFNEDKRLSRRHSIIEFRTSMHYIKEYLKQFKNPKILDIGAGAGRYSLELNTLGFDVEAVELVKHNIRVLEKKNKNIKTYCLNATNLKGIKDNTYDLILLFGPMYHLITKEEKIKAIEEAKRVLKDDGIIMIVYYMNDFAIIKHGFMENYIKESVNKLDKDFKINSNKEDLYSYVRIEEIDELNKITSLKRIKLISQDGPTDYLRKHINKMDDEAFELFYKYHLSTCERYEMLGRSQHLIDIVTKQKEI